MPDRERFTLVVELDPRDVPPMIRLRAALKCLLRSYGVRCVEPVRRAEPAKPAVEPIPEVQP